MKFKPIKTRTFYLKSEACKICHCGYELRPYRQVQHSRGKEYVYTRWVCNHCRNKRNRENEIYKEINFNIKSMLPEKIMSIVDSTCRDFNDVDKRHLKRYFIRYFCPWLPLRYIGKLTGVKSHDAVIESIKRVREQAKFNDVCEALHELRF